MHTDRVCQLGEERVWAMRNHKIGTTVVVQYQIVRSTTSVVLLYTEKVAGADSYDIVVVCGTCRSLDFRFFQKCKGPLVLHATSTRMPGAYEAYMKSNKAKPIPSPWCSNLKDGTGLSDSLGGSRLCNYYHGAHRKYPSLLLAVHG